MGIMSVYVCLYVCMAGWLSVCLYVRVCVCVYACMRVCMHKQAKSFESIRHLRGLWLSTVIPARTNEALQVRSLP